MAARSPTLRFILLALTALAAVAVALIVVLRPSAAPTVEAPASRAARVGEALGAPPTTPPCLA